MLNRSLSRVAIALLVVGLGLSACSSGKSSGPSNVPTSAPDASGWSANQVADIRTVAHRVDVAFPGQCRPFTVNNRAEYVAGVQKLGGPVPEAVGVCNALDEGLEISSFANAAARDKFVTARRDLLCKRADEHKVGLPGLYWVVGGNWSVQPDSEGVSRRVATALSAKYVATGCNGKNPGWEADGVAALESTGETLQKNKLGCSDLEMEDRDLVSHTPPFTVIGTPAAVATCTLAGNARIVLVSYDPTNAKNDALLQAELSRECGGAKTTRIARKGDWAVFTTDLATATRVANVLGGSVSPTICPKA